jgi:hypothetical protein
VLTVIKKIGDKVISIVEWPFVHASKIEKLIGDGMKDAPATKGAIIGLVEQFEAIGPNVALAIAAKGFDIPDDLKTGTDIKSLFTYFTGTFLPAVEKDYADLKADLPADTTTQAIAAAPIPAPAAAVVQPGPGLHTVTAG